MIRALPTHLPSKLISFTARSIHTNGAAVTASDPYKILGLEWGATNAEVKDCYRTLAKRHHPDVGSDPSADKFTVIHKAYTAITTGDRNSLCDNKEAEGKFSWQQWRRSDMIAQKRKDVAGEKRARRECVTTHMYRAQVQPFHPLTPFPLSRSPSRRGHEQGPGLHRLRPRRRSARRRHPLRRNGRGLPTTVVDCRHWTVEVA